MSADNLECIDVEVAYLCRKESGQWPTYQNEIHFHQTSNDYREIAESILKVLISRK